MVGLRGGIEGSYPSLLEFDYKKKVRVETCEGISDITKLAKANDSRRQTLTRSQNMEQLSPPPAQSLCLM
jgi:hypothetical protein